MRVISMIVVPLLDVEGSSLLIYILLPEGRVTASH